MWSLNLGLMTCFWKFQPERAISEQSTTFWFLLDILFVSLFDDVSNAWSWWEVWTASRPVQYLKSSYNLRFGFLLKGLPWPQSMQVNHFGHLQVSWSSKIHHFGNGNLIVFFWEGTFYILQALRCKIIRIWGFEKSVRFLYISKYLQNGGKSE